MKRDVDELRWVRVFSSVHIPHYLVEQVKDREYSVEDFCKYQDINCLIEGKNGPSLNPFNHLYVLANKDNIVKGFLWLVIEPLTKDLIINTFSIDKEYWGDGNAVRKVSDHVKEMFKKLKLKKVFWITNYPKHSERHGFKRSKNVLMEYTEEKDGQDTNRRNILQGKHQHVDSRTTVYNEQLSDTTRTTGTTNITRTSSANESRREPECISTELCATGIADLPATNSSINPATLR